MHFFFNSWLLQENIVSLFLFLSMSSLCPFRYPLCIYSHALWSRCIDRRYDICLKYQFTGSLCRSFSTSWVSVGASPQAGSLWRSFSISWVSFGVDSPQGGPFWWSFSTRWTSFGDDSPQNGPFLEELFLKMDPFWRSFSTRWGSLEELHKMGLLEKLLHQMDLPPYHPLTLMAVGPRATPYTPPAPDPLNNSNWFPHKIFSSRPR